MLRSLTVIFAVICPMDERYLMHSRSRRENESLFLPLHKFVSYYLCVLSSLSDALSVNKPTHLDQGVVIDDVLVYSSLTYGY